MIRNVRVFTVFNTIGKKTIKVEIQTDQGVYSASVPTGTSRGVHEAVDLPAEKAKEMLAKIKSNLIGLDEQDWFGIDKFIKQLDGTKNYSRIGGNLSLGISLAAAKASTNDQLWRLNKGVRATFPIPVSNIVGGGQHGGKTDWQEFLAIPYKAKDPLDAHRTLIELWTAVGEELKKKGLLIGRNIENAWISKLDDLETLYFLTEVAEDWNVKLGIDFAASSFWDGKKYNYSHTFGKKITPEQQLKLIMETAQDYGLYYLEDPFHENDFDSFSKLNYNLSKGALIVGDDLLCTSPSRVEACIKTSAANATIVKPNQVGSLSAVSRVAQLAMENKMTLVPSHRSTETEDPWLADLAVTFDAPLIKIGVLGPDLPKHNRLAQLWEEIPDVKMAKLPRNGIF